MTDGPELPRLTALSHGAGCARRLSLDEGTDVPTVVSLPGMATAARLRGSGHAATSVGGMVDGAATTVRVGSR